MMYFYYYVYYLCIKKNCYFIIINLKLLNKVFEDSIKQFQECMIYDCIILICKQKL